MLFLFWCELLSLPVRWVMVRWPVPADVRRMLSRVAGPLLFVLPVWFAAHGVGWALSRPFGLLWIGAGLGWGLWWARRAHRRDGVTLGALMGYEGRGGGLARGLALDALAAALLFGFVAVRQWVPEMTCEIGASAAEKFPNAMLFWSSWHARSLPPEDYWLAGHHLTYYYWGHFYWAWLARMGGFPVELALNLALIQAVTLVWVSAYLLARAAKLSPLWAVGAALCIAWAGNPDGVVQAINLLKVPGSVNWAGYSFWHPTRPTEIFLDEFPAFSAILGDFHSHHLALPWICSWVAISLAGRRWSGTAGSGGRKLALGGRPLLWEVIWASLAAASVLTNMWNVPLVGFAMGVMLILALRRGWRAFSLRLTVSLLLGLLLLAGVHLLRGGEPLPLPADPTKSFWARLPVHWLDPALRTSLWILFCLWGFPVLVLALAALAQLYRRTHERLSFARWAQITCVLAGAGLIALNAPLVAWKMPGGAAWVWGAVICWTVALMLGRRPWLTPAVGFMVIAGCIVLGGLELMYVKDRFEGQYVRYNSYFKFCYPVWPLLWVGAWCAGVHLWRLLRTWWPLAWGMRAALAGLFLISFVYTFFAIPARLIMASYGDTGPRQPTLDAFNFTRHRPLFNVEAPLLAWIRRNVPPGERVAEASSSDAGAYSYAGRVASLTGHPVPLGWLHHEEQWHGDAGYAMLNARVAAVDQLYRAGSPKELRDRAQGLGVSWVVFGLNERRQYGAGALAVLSRTAPVEAAFPAGQPEVFLFNLKSNTGR